MAKDKDKRSYFEMLQDPRWQRRKTEIQIRDNFTCQACGETRKRLEVHHKFYVTRKDPWDYTDDQLILLCVDCHELATHSMALLRSGLSHLEPHWHERVRGYVETLASVTSIGTRHRIELDLHNEMYKHGVADAMDMGVVDLERLVEERHPGQRVVSLDGSDLYQIHIVFEGKRGR